MPDSKDFKATLDNIIGGKQFPPNFEEIDLPKGIGIIASGANLMGTGAGNFKHPNGKSSWGHWAKFFLSKTQGGTLDGHGWVIWYDHGVGRVGEFSICLHKKKTVAGADPRRGWHPGHCNLCGLNMTVDSGD